MIPLLGALVMGFGVCTLFWLDRDSARISKCIWIPFAWLLIAGSRPVSSWLTLSAPVDATAQYIDGSPLDRNILTTLLILAVFALSKRMNKVEVIIRANIPLVFFFLFCGISMLWADYPFVVFKRWLRSVGDVVMILLIVTETNWPDAFKKVLTRAGYLLVPLSILFIRFYPSLGRSYTAAGVPMWTGVGTDKNALGMICMLFGVSLLWRGLNAFKDRSEKYRTRRLLSIAVLFVMVIYLLLVVNSQTALSCFVMASVLVAAPTLVPRFRNRLFLTLLLVAMIATTGSVLFLGAGSGALTAIGRNASLTGRTDVWRIVLPFATNPWVGAGYENFWIGERLIPIFRAVGAGLNQAHNGYIELYLNIGWVGLGLLGTIIVQGYRNIMRDLRRGSEMATLKLGFFLICLVYNFTEASFKMFSPVWIMFLWATMAVPQSRLVSATSNDLGVKRVQSGDDKPLAEDWYPVPASYVR